MLDGYIKLHRQFMEWEWYDDVNVKCLYLHCLMRANHKPGKWRGITIDTGQFISSQETLSAELHLSIRQIRTALDKLKATGEVTVKTTNKYSMFSISNWDKYQVDDRQKGFEKSVERQSNDNQMTTNKNDKNDKNDKNKDKEIDYSSWPSMPGDEILNEWLAMKKRLKAPVSQLVVNTFAKHLHLAVARGFSVDDCLSECVTRGWKGFKSEWMKDETSSGSGYGQKTGGSSKRTDLQHRQEIGSFIEEKANKAVRELSESSVSENESHISRKVGSSIPEH